MCFAKFRRHKFPSFGQIPAEEIEIGIETLRPGIHKLANYIKNNEELPDQWKESFIPIYKKGDKNGCSNYGDISVLSISHTTFSSIILSV
jgi:hypothetical protein